MSNDWKNPKWWQAVTVQVISMLTLIGMLTASQSDDISKAVTALIASVFVVVTNSLFIFKTLTHSQVSVGSPTDNPPSDDPNILPMRRG